jgi:hypothetical protein
MKRIEGADRVVDLFGLGKAGFKAEVPGISEGTEVTQEWLNGVQEAVVRTIEKAGFALSHADYDQFTNAILALIDQFAVARGRGVGQTDEAINIGWSLANKLKASVAGADKGNIAFESWVQEQITALVNSSPAALDTLKELADALGNDANFAATITNALAGKERKFDAGTRMVFQQSAAPVGYTKDLTHNNKALRLVNGNVGSGGTVAFTGAFAARNVDATTLSVAQMPVHDHDAARANIPFVDYDDGLGNQVGEGKTSTAGGGESHTHGINLDVQYVDLIIAVKD